MPPTMVAPGPFIDPPRAGTRFTVSYSFTVLTSHNTLPVALSYARRWPSRLPENTTPGIDDTAAGCPVLQPRRASHVSAVGGIVQRGLPSAMFTATIPPASPGFFSSALDSDT